MINKSDMENTDKRSGSVGVGVRIAAVLLFIIVAVVGMSLSVRVASAVPNAFSSLAAAVVSITSIFVPAGEEITLSTPSLTVGTGQAFTLSWTHVKKTTDGSYTFRYDCADGVHFTSPTASGSDQMVFCNIPFNFLNTDDSIVLTPVSDQNRFVDVKVYIDFTPNGASKPTVTGSTTVTVTNQDLTGSPAVTTPTTPVTTVPAPTTHR